VDDAFRACTGHSLRFTRALRRLEVLHQADLAGSGTVPATFCAGQEQSNG
jgi:hypothetical protein